MSGVAMMDLAVGELHAPALGEGVHGVARCGTVMDGPYRIGPAQVIAQQARSLCFECYPEWRLEGA